MTIGEMEKVTGLDRATIRFYEREGLLSPRRLENGYRDYAQQDQQTLLRIKLLRELGVSLEDIRALQQGKASLPATLEVRLQQLEQEIAASTQARETCRAIRDAGVSYQSLDAAQYLGRVSRPVVEDVAPVAVCPWRRFWARHLDLFLYTLLIVAVLTLVFHVNLARSGRLLSLVSSYLALGVMLVVEPLLLRLFGTTPGKAILGLRVTYQDGTHLSYVDAQARTWDVIARGMGWNLPIHSLYRLWKCYRAQSDGEEMAWDWEGEYAYGVKEGAWWRGAAFVAVYAACFALLVGMALAAGRPPHYGPLTPAQFAENYNFLASYWGDPATLLDEKGRWVQPDSGTVVIDLSPPPAIELETGADGTLQTVRVVWEFDGADGFQFWPSYTMELLAEAFAAGEQDGLSRWTSAPLPDWLNGVTEFESSRVEKEGVVLDLAVEQEGFLVAGATLIPQEDAETQHCTVTYTLSPAQPS